VRLHNGLLAVGIASLLLVGCGSNAKVVKSLDSNSKSQMISQKLEVNEIKTDVKDVPEHFLAAVKGHLKNELNKRGLLESEGKEANKIDLQVTYYRMRSGITRMMFGMFAGKDGIEADVTIRDAGTGEVLSQLTASSYNLMAVGGSEDIARMFAEKTAEEIEKSLN